MQLLIGFVIGAVVALIVANQINSSKVKAIIADYEAKLAAAAAAVKKI